MSYEAQTSWFLQCFSLFTPMKSQTDVASALRAAVVSHRSWSTDDAKSHHRSVRPASIGLPVVLQSPIILTCGHTPTSFVPPCFQREAQSAEISNPLRGLGGQSSDSDIPIMMRRCDLQSINMQIHIPCDVRQLEAMIILLSIDLPEQQPSSTAAA